ncbi:hypothetical protein RGU12_07930 [Fredinandcohnia sp. QZ13]|uniref:hypothetical protein n=1 Tax=Fredinandcohnia sp. QZ13 TaxID=3073144 RepID=UPI0028535D18|nr:hypothetical protein [Fredinandcohnia sp. QZ13]MDR4887489.1 hypothetical protein [Fredinandcohnia sp. QZ13]
MQAGCKKVEITPPVGAPIGGNVREDNYSRGVHDSLFANILYLNDGEKQILFIGMDVVAVPGFLVKRMKTRIELECGIGANQITIFATHTHSGPDIMECFKDDFHPIIIKYLDELVEKVVSGVTSCIEHKWTAEIGVGKGFEESVAFNRRIFMKDGSLKMNFEPINLHKVDKPAGPIDPDLFVLSVRDEQQNIQSLLVNYTLHSAILVGKDWLLSRDFIHKLTVKLESVIDENLVVLFANGASGNINHININEPNQSRGFEEADRVGEILADKVLEVIRSINYSSFHQINVLSKQVQLPRREITSEMAEEAKMILDQVNWKVPSLLDGVPKEGYAKEIIALSKIKEDYIETELQVIQIGDHAITCLPGEFFVEQGLTIKTNDHFKETMVFGLANDCVGYVPTENAFVEGGYEIKTARSSQLLPIAGQMVVDEILCMLKEVKKVNAV